MLCKNSQCTRAHSWFDINHISFINWGSLWLNGLRTCLDAYMRSFTAEDNTKKAHFITNLNDYLSETHPPSWILSESHHPSPETLWPRDNTCIHHSAANLRSIIKLNNHFLSYLRTYSFSPTPICISLSLCLRVPSYHPAQQEGLWSD